MVFMFTKRLENIRIREYNLKNILAVFDDYEHKMYGGEGKLTF